MSGAEAGRAAALAENRFVERFAGSAAWSTLPAEVQAAVGAAALELVVAWTGQDAYGNVPEEDEGKGADPARPFFAAEPAITDALFNLLSDHLHEVLESAEPMPVPSLLGPVCRACGCSESDACQPFSCGWAEENLCTACAPAAEGTAA